MRSWGRSPHAPGTPAGRWPAVVGACLALSALAPRPRTRPTATIDGSPLNVYANDVGRLQVAFDGSASGEFYTGAAGAGRRRAHASRSSASAPTPSRSTARRGGTPFTPGVARRRSRGDGSAGNPWRLHDGVRRRSGHGRDRSDVSEVVQYVNGTDDVTVTYTLSAP